MFIVVIFYVRCSEKKEKKNHFEYLLIKTKVQYSFHNHNLKVEHLTICTNDRS